MFENYEKQGAREGQSVPFEIMKLRNPDGSHPVVHLEHLGASNAKYKELVIANAGKGKAVERRALLRCSAVRLERTFKSDGTLATDADLSAFIEKIPLSIVEQMLAFAMNEENFAEYPIASDPETLAEK